MTDQKAGSDRSGVINDVDGALSVTSGISTTLSNFLNIDGLAGGYANHANVGRQLVQIPVSFHLRRMHLSFSCGDRLLNPSI